MSAAASSAALAQAAASGSVTAGLLAWSAGDAAALHALVPGVYAELRRQARRALRRELGGHTLQPTALVHEAYLRLLDQERGQWRNRAQFFGIAAQLMRRILVDHARARHAAKRGGGARQRTLGAVDVAAAAAEEAGTDVLALHEPLTRLAALDRRGGAAGGATLLRWPHDRGDRRRVGRLASDDEAAVDRRPRLAPARVGHGGRESGACMTRPPRGALTPERWQQVKTMLQAAQERAHVERAALLGAACAADPALRGEVASLLAAVDGAMPILDPPAVALRRPRAALLRGGGERDLEDVEDAADADDETAEAAATAARIWATLEAALVGRYTLERELGRGGRRRCTSRETSGMGGRWRSRCSTQRWPPRWARAASAARSRRRRA